MDWSGKYPPIGREKELLIPAYLSRIPECPRAGKDAYVISSDPTGPYNAEGLMDYYYIQCTSTHHAAVGVPSNYPQFGRIQGLIAR